MIKSAIFDVDGTLLDSMKIWDDAGERYLSSVGKTAENGLSEKLCDMSLTEGAEYMKKQYALSFSTDEIVSGVLKIIEDFYFYEVGLKNDAKETIEELKKQKIKTFMFTGDKKETALNIGKKLNIDEIKYEMLPTDKFEEFEKVSSKNELTIFVGDGINDAPVLKRADIGISMGGVGTDSAIEASDIVLMSDDLKKIPVAIQISKYTKNIIRQNLVFSISMKIIILLLSVLGFANMWLAVFADTGLTLLTILNTLRIMKRFA